MTMSLKCEQALVHLAMDIKFSINKPCIQWTLNISVFTEKFSIILHVAITTWVSRKDHTLSEDGLPTA